MEANTTFPDFYPRDTTYLQGENSSRLGPIVSAGGIVNVWYHTYFDLNDRVFSAPGRKIQILG